MVTKTEKRTAGDVVLFEEDDFYSRDVVTVASGADLDVGMVVGKVTASGKYAAYDPTAADGTETVAGVLIQEAAAASADVAGILILARHARVKRSGLLYAAAVDDATKRDTAVAGLKAIGILTDV